jgi:hypothetical protein
MKVHGEVEVQLHTHTFITSAIDRDDMLASHPGQFIPKEEMPGIHCVGG